MSLSMKKSDLFDPDEIQPWYLTDRKQRGGNKYVNKKVKLVMKFCKSCNKVWEHYRMNNKRQTLKYDDLPTLGLPREKCDKCRE